MAKPVISSKEELYQKIYDEIFVVDTAEKEQMLIEMVSDRYNRNANIYNMRMADFTSREKVGLNGNMLGALNQFRRLDDMSESMNFDPSLTAMMMGMSDAAGVHYKDASKKMLYPMFKDSVAALEKKYEIPADVKKAFKTEADEVAYEFSVKDLGLNMDEASLEQYPLADRINLVCCGVSSFYDSRAFLDDNNQPVPITRAVTQLYAEASAKGEQLLQAAFYEGTYQPQNEQEAKQIETLRNAYGYLSEDKKQAALQRVRECANPSEIIDEPVMVEPYKLSMKLEKNVVLKDMTIESFTEKSATGTLTPAEKEWGEATVDRMLQQLYSEDDLRKFKAAKVDPATEIYVDTISALDLPTGKSVKVKGEDVPETFRMRFETAEPRLEDYAEMKCAIVAASLNGKALDANKLRINPDGDIHRSETTLAVNVQNDMKREPVSLWHRFLRFLGIEKAPEDKTLESNSAAKHRGNDETIRERIGFEDLVGTAPRRTTAAAEPQPSREKSVQK